MTETGNDRNRKQPKQETTETGIRIDERRRLLVKPGTPEHRNSINPEHGTPEH